MAMGESNTKGGHSIKNTGTEDTGKNPATTRGGSNSPRVPANETGPTAVSGGTRRDPQ
jgi:hypothetical protein